MLEALPFTGCFTACMGVYFPKTEMENWHNCILPYMQGIKMLACSIETNFKCAINQYSNCILHEFWKLMKTKFQKKICFNQFVSNAPFLYLLKTSENLIVFWCFHEGRERVQWKHTNWLKYCISDFFEVNVPFLPDAQNLVHRL